MKLTSLLTAALLVALCALTVQAAETPQLINLQNTPEIPGVTHRAVSFDSNGVTLKGTLYMPEKRDGKLPAAIATGAWMTVKEQMPGTYARELAERGFVALAFDFTGWGESGGTVRHLEDPATKAADIIAAAQFLATQPEVDADKIYGLGICASSGYMADAVAASPLLKKLAMVAAWLHAPKMAEKIYGGPESVARLIATSRKAAKAGNEEAVAASNSDKSAIMYQVPYYTEKERGMIPAWGNRFNLASWEPWLTYDAQHSADLMTKPVLIVCSEAAALPAGAHAYAARLEKAGKASLKQLWLTGATQFDFYDHKEVVEESSDAVAAFFRGE